MIAECTLLKCAINHYCYENNLRLKDTHIYIDSALTTLYINDFKFYGGNNKADFLVSNAIKLLICKYAATNFLKIDNLRTELEKLAPYRKQTFIDISKGNDFFIKYKIQLYEI